MIESAEEQAATPNTEEQSSEVRCICPDHHPNWHNQDVDLSRHCVHLMPISAFFHMPIALEFYRRKQAQDIANLELQETWPGFSLTRLGMFGGQMIRPLEETNSPSRYVSYLEGSFKLRAKLHNGDIGTVKQTLGEMQMELLDEGCRPKELYLGYLTCPVCEERKGGPKILVARRWVESEGLKKRSRQKK